MFWTSTELDLTLSGILPGLSKSDRGEVHIFSLEHGHTAQLRSLMSFRRFIRLKGLHASVQ